MAEQPQGDGSDIDAVLDVAEGDHAALERLVRGFGPKLLGYLRHKIGDEQLAEDAFQNVFTRFCEQIEDYDESRGKPEAWLMQIAKYEVLTAWKARKRQAKRGSDLPVEEVVASVPSSQVLELRERMVAVVHRVLTAPQERVIALAWIGADGKPDLEEIARAYGWSVRALSVALVRAKAKLIPALRAEGLDPSAMVGD